MTKLQHTVSLLMEARHRSPFAASVIFLAIIYVAMAWSPSSYGLALTMLGAPGEGLVAGQPQPIRSDEWIVWTPYLQTAVNNGFERFNEHSPYHEDLRNFNGLPLLDWALPFKPQFWPFFFADPAYAFSFSHAIFIALFLIGYSKLIRVLGFYSGWAAAGSILLFFTSYSQFWWTTTGPLLAVFPWLLLVVLAQRLASWMKALALIYLVPFWLLAHAYPPIILSLAFSGVILLVALRPEALRPSNLLPCAAGAAVGLALSYAYLAEPFAIMAQTVYPGQRISHGGIVPPAMWLAQFFPFLVTWPWASLIVHNLAEASTGGSFLTVLVAIFIDHRILWQRFSASDPEARRLRGSVLLLLVGFLLMSAWMTLPIPPGVGQIFLWHKIQPNRLVFAAGILLLLLGLIVMQAAPMRLSRMRIAIAMGITVGAWLASKAGIAGKPWALRGLIDLVPLVPLAALALWKARLSAGSAATALVASAAFINAAGFGWFNPIQSAQPIFHRPQTAVTATLDHAAAAHSKGWLVAGGFPGALLSGWGYQTIAHVLIAPQVDFFRPFFPELDSQTLDTLFNRYAHVQLHNIPEPTLLRADVVKLPMHAFLSDGVSKLAATAAPSLTGRFPTGGHIDSIVTGERTIVVGWGFLDGISPDNTLHIRAPFPVKITSVKPLPRPDVSKALGDQRLSLSGFILELQTDQKAPITNICIVSESPTFGRFLLPQGGSAANQCGDLQS